MTALFPEIGCFEDFTAALRKAGMTIGGQNSEGVFTLCDFFGPNIRWHTEDPETDPWEWRVRVLDETEDIAYGKLFFKKSGYLTREWLPDFLAVRRNEPFFRDLLEDPVAKRIYEIVRENGPLPLHIIKQLGFFSREEQKDFEKALVFLQSGLFLTMCGRARKKSRNGEEYGWSSTVFCLTEDRFGTEIFRRGSAQEPGRAYAAIQLHLLSLNPEAAGKKLEKFILGH